MNKVRMKPQFRIDLAIFENRGRNERKSYRHISFILQLFIGICHSSLGYFKIASLMEKNDREIITL